MQGRGEESHDSQWAGFRDPNKFPQRSLLFLTVTSAAQSARPRFHALISELKSSVSCLPRRLQGSLQRCPRDVAAPCGPAGGHQAGRAGPAGHSPPCTAASLGTPRRWLPAAPAAAGRDGRNGTSAMGWARRDPAGAAAALPHGAGAAPPTPCGPTNGWGGRGSDRRVAPGPRPRHEPRSRRRRPAHHGSVRRNVREWRQWEPGTGWARSDSQPRTASLTAPSEYKAAPVVRCFWLGRG